MLNKNLYKYSTGQKNRTIGKASKFWRTNIKGKKEIKNYQKAAVYKYLGILYVALGFTNVVFMNYFCVE